MEIQLSEEVEAALVQKTSAHGMSVSDDASHLMSEQLQEDTRSAMHRERTVDAFREHMKT